MEQRYTTQDSTNGQASCSNGLTYGAPEEDITSQKIVTASTWQPEYEYAEPPLTRGSSATFSSPGLESLWNPFDESFGNAYAWQQWDTHQTSVSSSQEHSSVDYGLESTSIGQTNRSTAISNYATPETPKMPKTYFPASTSYLSEDHYNEHNSDASYHVTASDFACQQAESSAAAPKSTKSHRRERNHSTSSSKKSGSTVGFASDLKRPRTDTTN